jgi:hypothetical protein
MNSLNFGMLHTCKVISTSQDQKLNFTSGTAVFTVGSVLTGATSKARGTIKSITLSSGSWSSGNAAGYLILSNVSGTFESESISDTGTGRATASGPAIPHTNGVGTPQTTTVITEYACKFANTRQPGGSLPYYESGKYVASETIVFLPADAVVMEGDHITSTESGYNHTYEVTNVSMYENFFSGSIDHIEASLTAVEKR